MYLYSTYTELWAIFEKMFHRVYAVKRQSRGSIYMYHSRRCAMHTQGADSRLVEFRRSNFTSIYVVIDSSHAKIFTPIRPQAFTKVGMYVRYETFVYTGTYVRVYAKVWPTKRLFRNRLN